MPTNVLVNLLEEVAVVGGDTVSDVSISGVARRAKKGFWSLARTERGRQATRFV